MNTDREYEIKLLEIQNRNKAIINRYMKNRIRDRDLDIEAEREVPRPSYLRAQIDRLQNGSS